MVSIYGWRFLNKRIKTKDQVDIVLMLLSELELLKYCYTDVALYIQARQQSNDTRIGIQKYCVKILASKKVYGLKMYFRSFPGLTQFRDSQWKWHEEEPLSLFKVANLRWLIVWRMLSLHHQPSHCPTTYLADADVWLWRKLPNKKKNYRFEKTTQEVSKANREERRTNKPRHDDDDEGG